MAMILPSFLLGSPESSEKCADSAEPRSFFFFFLFNAQHLDLTARPLLAWILNYINYNKQIINTKLHKPQLLIKTLKSADDSVRMINMTQTWLR